MFRLITKNIFLFSNILIALLMVLLISNCRGSYVKFVKCIKVLDYKTVHIWNKDLFFCRRQEVFLYGVKCSDKFDGKCKKAKYYLKKILTGKTIKIHLIKKGIFGSITAIVYYNKKCINEELIKNQLLTIDHKKCTSEICSTWEKYCKKQ